MRYSSYLLTLYIMLLCIIYVPVETASAQNNDLVDVDVHISKLLELTNSDQDGSRSDYYPIVNINGQIPEGIPDIDRNGKIDVNDWRQFETTSPTNDFTNVNWDFWVTQAYTDTVTLQIQLWDRDGIANGDDDQVDIHEGGGLNLDLTLSLANCVISGGVQGTCGAEISTFGDDEGCNIFGFDCDGNAWIYFTVTLNNPSKRYCKLTDYDLNVYKSYQDIQNQLNDYANRYPTLAHLIPLQPKTVENRDIFALKISDNAAVKEDEPRVLFLGTHHAREWISTQIPLLLADYLLANYAKCEEVRTLVDSSEIWIVPVVNPDGYEYTRTGDPLSKKPSNPRQWRKNRNNGQLDRTFPMFCSMQTPFYGPANGVDINRNYSIPIADGRKIWDSIDNYVTSNNCASDQFKGPAPESENETQAIERLMMENSFAAALTYHSSSKAIMYPFGYTTDSSHDTRLIDMANFMVNILNDPALPINVNDPKDPLYDYGTYYQVQSCCLYDATGSKLVGGSFEDWAYKTFNIPVFTNELSPGREKVPDFVLPVDKIQPVWEANKPAALCLIKYVIQNGIPAICGNTPAPTRSTINAFAAALPQGVKVIAPPNREVQPGQNLTLNFTVQNIGSATETYNLIIGRGEEGSWVDTTNIPTQVTINAGSSIVVQVPVVVPAADQNPETGIANILAISQSNPDIRDNVGTKLMIPPANLYVKIAPAFSSSPATERHFLITYGNIGRAAAVNVAVGIDLPPNVSYVSDSQGGLEPLVDNIHVWYLGTIPANTQNTIEVVIKPPSANTQTNLINAQAIAPSVYPLLQVGIVSGMIHGGYATKTPEVDITNNSVEISSNAVMLTATNNSDGINANFEPNLQKLGLVVPSQNGSGSEIRWTISVTNQGTDAGINLVFVDDVPQGLHIKNVVNDRGQYKINGQQVTLKLDRLEAGESFEFSIFTTISNSTVAPINTVTLTADNLDRPRTATSFAAGSLPITGETPWWRNWVIAMLGIGTIVMGILVLRQAFHHLEDASRRESK